MKKNDVVLMKNSLNVYKVVRVTPELVIVRMVDNRPDPPMVGIMHEDVVPFGSPAYALWSVRDGDWHGGLVFISLVNDFNGAVEFALKALESDPSNPLKVFKLDGTENHLGEEVGMMDW